MISSGRHVTGPGLERLEERRGSPDLIGEDALVVTVQGHRALVHGDGMAVETVASLGAGDGAEGAPGLVFLAEHDGQRFAGRAVSEAEAAVLEADGRRFESLRWLGGRLPEWQVGLLFYAAGLLAWHDRTRHCGVCGAPTQAARSGHQRVCTDGACGQIHFPRADPAIITLVRHDDRALLVHQPDWPDGRFSTLAGFVEPGETLEQTVAREVDEEVGLTVVRTEYFASQPWPFPHTLMVGFRTDVEAGDVVLGEELTDARWFTRAELRDAMEGESITVPAPFALSRSLIDDWLEH